MQNIYLHLLIRKVIKMIVVILIRLGEEKDSEEKQIWRYVLTFCKIPYCNQQNCGKGLPD